MHMATNQPSTSKPHWKTYTSTQQIFCTTFQDLEDLIAINEYTYEVDQQLKIDRCNLNDTANLTQATITSPFTSIILRKSQTKQKLIKLHHGSLFSTFQSTLVKAIKDGHLLTWSGSDENIVTKYLLPPLNTEKIHLQQGRRHLQSTKISPLPDEEINTVKSHLKCLLKKKNDRQILQ